MPPIIQRGNQLESQRASLTNDPVDGKDATNKDYVDASAGAQGFQGFQGFQGPNGTAGGPSQRYNYSSATSGFPSTGNYRLNNASPGLATQIVANQTNLAGVNSSSWFNGIAPSQFVIYLETNSSTHVVYSVTSVTFDNPNSVVVLNVTVFSLSPSPAFSGVSIFSYAISGVVGTQGFQGAQGFQGTAGPQGFQGFQGNVGVQGFQGFQGVVGSQGAPGPQGNQGFQGPADGFQGFQGFQGDTGVQGAQGFQGRQGFQGVVGAQGFQGFQGNAGAQGNQGVIGAQGNQGIAGSQGAQGNQGFQGPADGAQGFQGFQGAQGNQGFQGFQGVVGAQGFQGFQGNVGAQGSEGSGGDTQLYEWDTGTTDANPGSGKVRFNNATYASVTQIFASTLNVGGVDITGWLDAIDDFGQTANRGVLKLFKSSNPNIFITFIVTGTVTSATLYRKLAVTFQHESGGTFTAGDDTAFTWTYTGNQGAQGIQGQTGAPGNDGAQGTQGFQGRQGFQGLTGAQGTAGSTGAQGNQGAQGSGGAQGFQGHQGATGNQGSQGFQGTSGDSSAGGDTQLFFFSTDTTDSDPGDGYLKFNNATYASVTFMYVDLLNQSLVDVTGWLESLDNYGSSTNRGTIKIYKKTDVNTFATFVFTGSVVSATGYRKFALTYQDDSGTTISLNDEVCFTFAFAGPAGTQGFQGLQGFQGFQGNQGNQGFQGPQGFQGFQGSQGHQGFQGVAGNDPRFLWLFAT